MRSNIFKLLLFIFYIILTLFIKTVYPFIMLIIITTIIVIMSNISLKQLINYILKIKYFYLLLLFVPFSIKILYFIIKVTLIYIVYICYIKTTSLFKRYNTLYNILKPFKLEVYAYNILLFLPIFYKEIKNIKYLSLKSIIYNVNKKIKTLSSRFIGFENQKETFYSEDFSIILIIVLFFIITIYAR